MRCLTDAGRLVNDQDAVEVNGNHEMPGGLQVVAWLGIGTVAYVALGLLGRDDHPGR